MNTSFEHWQLTIDGRAAFLTINRPEKKNRIGSKTLSELAEITALLNDLKDVWVVIVQGQGDDFSAGADVSLIGGMMQQNKEEYGAKLKASQVVLDQFEALNKPTIAIWKGYVIGAGVILGLCCDFRIALDNCKISLPEVKRSIGVIMGTQRITKTIGISATKELVMLGREIYADRAFSLGLVHEVIDSSDVEKAIQGWIEEICALPPLAVSLCKQIVNEGMFLERAGQDLEIELQWSVLQSDDFREAIDSFFAKRKPKYMGA